MDSLGSIVLYFIVAIAITVFSVMAVTSRRILRSATYLLFVLLATAVMYFQLGYQFLGAVQIAVYAGGILVLFVFAILLTARPGEKSPVLETHRRVWGTLAAVAGAALLGYALISMFCCPEQCAALCGTAEAATVDMQSIGHALLGTEKFQYLLPFEAVSVLLLACIIGGVVVARKR